MNAQHHRGWKLTGIFLLAVPCRSLRLAYPAIVLAVWSFSQDLLRPGMLQAILLNVSAHCWLIFEKQQQKETKNKPPPPNLRVFFCSFCSTSSAHLFKGLFRGCPFLWNEMAWEGGTPQCTTAFPIAGDSPQICTVWLPLSGTGSELTSDSRMPAPVRKQLLSK